MNKRPVSYLQNDPRWKDKPYRVKGENSTVGVVGMVGLAVGGCPIQLITVYAEMLELRLEVGVVRAASPMTAGRRRAGSCTTTRWRL